jgi:hypothetical protein
MKALICEKASSIGLKSGEYGGKNPIQTPGETVQNEFVFSK